MVLIAESRLVVFRSGSLSCAMSRTCFLVTLPTLFLLGSPEPFSMPAAFFKSTAAGGVLVTNVNDRSLKTVMTTGMMRSPCCAVRALNSLQNCMMFTPCWPSAGPTGGEGLALPAGTWSLMNAVTFFMASSRLPRCLGFLDLREVQLDGRGAPEDRDQDTNFLLL